MIDGADGVAGLRRPLRFPGDDEPHFTVGQAAELLGVQPAFLRRLEVHDAVRPSRTAGGQRRYTRQQVEHVGALATLMDDGLTLAGAMRIVALQAEVDTLRARLASLDPG